jgi:hypothetical protein
LGPVAWRYVFHDFLVLLSQERERNYIGIQAPIVYPPLPLRITRKSSRRFLERPEAGARARPTPGVAGDPVAAVSCMRMALYTL